MYKYTALGSHVKNNCIHLPFFSTRAPFAFHPFSFFSTSCLFPQSWTSQTRFPTASGLWTAATTQIKLNQTSVVGTRNIR